MSRLPHHVEISVKLTSRQDLKAALYQPPNHDSNQLTPQPIMNSLRIARTALRARPAAVKVPFQRRGYAEAVSDKVGTCQQILRSGLTSSRSSWAWLSPIRYVQNGMGELKGMKVNADEMLRICIRIRHGWKGATGAEGKANLVPIVGLQVARCCAGQHPCGIRRDGCSRKPRSFNRATETRSHWSYWGERWK